MRGMIVNYASSENHCQIIQCSSEIPNGQGQHILTSVDKQVWITNSQPPHYVVLDLKSMIKKPQIINCIGFYCWLDYDTNPKVIQIAVKYDLISNWTTMGKFMLQRKIGWQQFKLAKQINTQKVKQLKITILENFGGDQTYLNQIGLYYIEQEPQNSSAKPLRDKPLYSYGSLGQANKLTSTEKQLKRANEKIGMLMEQQKSMKKTLQNQNDIIMKMQQTIKKLVGHVSTLAKNQQTQGSALKKMDAAINNDQIIQTLPMMKNMENSQYRKQPKTMFKNKTFQIKRNPPKQEIPNIVVTDRNDSSSQKQFSHYSKSPKKNCNYVTLLEKLEKLIALKEQKKSQLKNSKKSGFRSNSAHEDSDSSYY